MNILLRKYFSLFMLSALLLGLQPISAFAKDGMEDSDDQDQDQEQETTDDTEDETEDVDDNSEDDSDEDETDDSSGDDGDDDDSSDDSVEDELNSAEDDAQDSDVEDIEEEDLEDDLEDELKDLWKGSDYPDTYYVSVRWGMFDQVYDDTLAETTWDGSVNFEGSAVGRPTKTLYFEKDEDSVSFSDITKNSTPFVSIIHGANDGLLFKARVNMEDTGELAPRIFFSSAYSGDVTVSFEELLTTPHTVLTYGDYSVQIDLWDHEDWITHESDQSEVDSSSTTDADTSAWYNRYMNLSMGLGFFSGYKDEHGNKTGKIGPDDHLTRFQTLKVLYELAVKLDMGVGATTCDPATVTLTDEVSWTEDNWASGYVQCIYDSDYSLTMLEDMQADVDAGNDQALRWEVIATAFEMLGLEVDTSADSDLTDVESSGLKGDFKSMLETAVELGVISGYPDHSFQPHRGVNRAEMFKIVSIFYEVLSAQ